MLVMQATATQRQRREAMTALIWTSIVLGMFLVLGWVGVALRTTFKHSSTTPDFSEAHAYLAAKQRQSALHR